VSRTLSLPSGVSTVVPESADAALVRLYDAHYAELVRVAVLLVRDPETAEDVVQDAFVQVWRRWPRLADRERAVGYLRTCVVNGARSALRRRGTERRHAERVGDERATDAPGADEGTLVTIRSRAVLDALQARPRRQREVLVLRHYLDLSEAEIADALGIGRGSVKTHASRAAAALRTTLEELR
jgi:RNA polymerase sigma-70 factor (sigma-E family)